MPPLQKCSSRRSTLAKEPYATPRSRADGGNTTDGREAERRGQPRCRGKLRRFGGYRVVARSAARGGERSLPCPRNRATGGAGGAERLAGQMSKRHAAAAACDGKGIRVDGQCRAPVRDPNVLTDTGSPIRTSLFCPRPAAVAVGARPDAAMPRRSSSLHGTVGLTAPMCMWCGCVSLNPIQGTTK